MFVLAATLMAGGCAASRQTPQERADAARALFEETTRQYHVPSAEVSGPQRTRLQSQAEAGYRALLNEYPDQHFWAAQALRSLGNLAAARTNLTAAVDYYHRVSRLYPEQDWEILMAWKSAADLLWDHGRQEEARAFYRRILARFDQPDPPQVVQAVVRGSQARLQTESP